jgi:hypothetical protein
MARSLKVWMSVNAFGVDAFRAAIDRCLDLAALAQRRIEESGKLELLSPAKLGIVCFRRRFGGGRSETELKDLNRRLVAALEASGYGMVSSTELRGRYAIRLCVLNHTSGEADVLGVLDWLETAEIDAAAASDGSGPAEPGADLNRGLTDEWAGDGETQDPIASTRIFRGLAPEQASALARDSQIRTAAVGEPVTTRWSAGRDFFVILDGRARVELGEEVVSEIGPGEFFGELAALDWGAGYGYVRTATVRAIEPLTLLVVPAERLNALIAESPAVAAEIEAAVRQRLPRS